MTDRSEPEQTGAQPAVPGAAADADTDQQPAVPVAPEPTEATGAEPEPEPAEAQDEEAQDWEEAPASDSAPETRADVGAAAATYPVTPPVGLPKAILDGHVLSNRYRLTDRIATGGMGEVWRGTDELLGRPVAVKLLRPGHADDEQFQIRFRAEARYAASLSHRGIAQVFDYGESDQEPGHPAGVPYLVMELVEGEPLSAALARDGHLSTDATMDLVAQAAAALGAAHAAGIVHRDIKPGNLLITPDGRIKITDFGIARAALAASHLTQTGMVMGTAQYVSPEQASALPVTTASDIYSLGVVAYECLAGRPPFTAETPIALALAHVRTAPPALPDTVPPGMSALVGQMLAKDPAQRPATAQLVAERARALKSTAAGDEDPWIIRSAPLTDPASWFAAPGQDGTAPGRSGTAPMAAAALATGPAPPPHSRHPVALILAIACVLAVLSGGTIAILAAIDHPAATASTGHTGRPSHQASTAARRPEPRQDFLVGGTGTPSEQPSKPSPSASTSGSATPTTSPTVIITPSSGPDPSMSPPQGSQSPTPPTSPSPTPTATGQPTTSVAQQAGSQLAKTLTQDG